MKRITTLMIIVIGLLTFGCSEEGPMGPAGPQGPEGPEGPEGPAGESAFLFEFEDINFTSPEYEVYLTYPNDFEGLDSDVALVYFLWDIATVDGVDLEVWRPLPQTVIDQRGNLVYNYDFTKNDVRLFLQATFNLDLLQAIDTDNWIASVVIVPGNFWSSARMQDGIMDYHELMEALNLPDLPVNAAVMKRR